MLNYPYLGIFAFNYTDFTICAIFTLYMHSSIETTPPCKMLEQSDHYSWRYCECSLCVNLVIDNFLVCSFRYFTSVYNLKAMGLLVMEILHFEDLGDTGVVWLRTQLF